tara:strand:+ start:1281 stop:1457 length:177 start_codon:yes stop_codon:yes gene_type:complete
MEIKNAKYMESLTDQEKIGISTTISGTDVTVPLDPDNRHYAEIMRQVAAGELTIEDAD